MAARRVASRFLLCLSLLGLVVSYTKGDEQDTHNPLEKIHLSQARVHREHIRLSVNITTLTTNGEHVEVTWSGVKHPSFDDWIGVLAPADADISERAPVKYKLASSELSHVLRGEGRASFILENHRTDMRLAFFRNGFENPHMVAESERIEVPSIDRPGHGRIALTADPEEMLVQWTTGGSAGGVVRWGRRSGEYEWSVAARDITYTRHDMCGGAASGEGWLDPGVFHYAVITGLEPATRYYYIFGADDTGFSDEFSFVSAPVTGPDTEVRVLCLADLGQAEIDGSNEQSEMLPSLNTTALMLADAAGGDYHLIVHHGDISYARGYVTQWDRFHEQMEPLVANIPYMITVGNHERDWPGSGDRFPSMRDSGGECGVSTERRFLMPVDEQDMPWYSFDYGPIHFLHYSTEHDFSKHSKQWDFIKRDLEGVDRTLTPWIVVGGHRPFYIDSSNTVPPDGDQPVAEELRDALEDLFYEAKVDVTFHGHHHSYQRTCPVYRGQCMGRDAAGVPLAPIHLVIGNAGAALCLNVQKETPPIFDKLHLWWGYTRLFANGTTLHLQMMTDLDGSMIDELVINKPRGWGREWHATRASVPAPRPTRRRQWWWEREVIGSPPQVRAVQEAAAMQSQDMQPDMLDMLRLRDAATAKRSANTLRGGGL